MTRLLSLGLIIVVTATAGAATAAQAPKPPRLHDWCVNRADRRAAIAFRATDGVRLVGVLLGPRTARAGVVLSHEGQGGLCNWLAYGRRLARLGYRVLVYDARGHISSPRPRARRTRHELDVAGAVRELRRRGATRVVLAGGSLGAMSSLVAATMVTPPVAGVISVSPGLSFLTLDPLAAAPALRVPALYLAAEGDDVFPDFARQLYAATGSADKELVVVPGAGHGFELVQPSRPEVRELFESFLREHTSG